MISPVDLIKYNRTQHELEELILFLVMVAGKNAEIESIKLEWFLAEGRHWYPHHSPMEYVYELEKQPSHAVEGESALMERLRHWKISPYGMRYNAFWTLALKTTHLVGKPAALDLRTCDRLQLVDIPGISMKTASLFIMDSRPGTRMAALDTHILAEMREEWGFTDAPTTSPQDPVKYAHWEGVYLEMCSELGMDPALLDLQIWTRRSQARTNKAPA